MQRGLGYKRTVWLMEGTSAGPEVGFFVPIEQLPFMPHHKVSKPPPFQKLSAMGHLVAAEQLMSENN